MLKGTRLEVVNLNDEGVKESDLLVHDQYTEDPGIHTMVARMMPPELPVALGIIRSVAGETYDQQMEDTIASEKEKSAISSVDELLNSGNTWLIK